MYYVTSKPFHSTIVAVGKASSITYCECVFVALDIQHAMHMRHIVFRSMLRSTIRFPHYLINATIFKKSY